MRLTAERSMLQRASQFSQSGLCMLLCGSIAFAAFLYVPLKERMQWSSSTPAPPDALATPDASAPSTVSSSAFSGGVESEGAVAQNTFTETGRSGPGFTVSADEPALPVNERLSILPFYGEQGRFVGYKVSGRSGDYRFAHGDVIASINGQPVEDSAAGSELLLIAIAHSGTDLGIVRP